MFLYSNSGYLLLAKVVERVSGKSLRAFAAERIFEPLGMRHTVFFDDPGQVIEDRAIPYARDGGDGNGAWQTALWFLPFTGPSGLFTNVEDLAKWDANFYDNRLGGGAALIERMQTPGTLENGESTGYGFGWRIDDDRLLLFTVHSAFLPKPKTPIQGPGGIQASFAWQAAKDSGLGKTCTAVLINDVAAY